MLLEGNDGNKFNRKNICRYWRHFWNWIGDSRNPGEIRRGCDRCWALFERCRDSEWWLRSIRPDVEVDYITADLSLQREVHQASRSSAIPFGNAR
jgi:hypothetical protein